VTVAPVVGDAEGNAARVAAAIDGADADVVVLPELALSGYVFETAAEVAAGEPPAWWARPGKVVVGGFAEAAGDAVFNSAAIVDSSGVRAVYRKAHLWDREPECFRPGDARPPVVDTPHGRIGLMVCYDLEFPEWVRAVALEGAELLCVPTNWPVEPRPDGERPMEVLKTMVHAATNRMAIAACDRCGAERGVEWVSGSAIAGPDGWLLAGPPGREPALLVADVDLAATRDKALGPRNDVHADRRPALYQAPLH
jgi:5-aminopentanamidase